LLGKKGYVVVIVVVVVVVGVISITRNVLMVYWLQAVEPYMPFGESEACEAGPSTY